MSSTNDILSNVPLPRMIRVKQNFPANTLNDVSGALQKELQEKINASILKPGMQIAITAGSRGIANMPLVLRGVCDYVKQFDCKPFIVPSMGSHGGATAEGQIDVLRALGVTEESMGVPIRSSMETVCIHEFEDGFQVFVDATAFQADGIIVVNRIKPHTSFRGRYESGLMKMMCVGLGKQAGANQIHKLGPKNMGNNIERGGKKILETGKILFGVALSENSYDQTRQIDVLLPDEILEKEPLLQETAKENMPKILFDNLDVLIIDKIGKNISGPGMDPNITYTFNPSSGISCEKRAHRIVVLDLTDETHGAAVGMGNADFITRRLFDKIDFDNTYPNLLTAGFPEPGKIPMIMDSQKLAIQAAIKTAALQDMTKARIVRIPDTLHLGEIEISESLLDEAKATEGIHIIGEPSDMSFTNGNLF